MASHDIKYGENLLTSYIPLKIINYYAPTEDSAESTKDSFYRLLKKQFLTVTKKQKVLCIGGFNATSSASVQLPGPIHHYVRELLLRI